MNVPRWLLRLPIMTRFVVAGGLLAGIAGGAAGLGIGLRAYPPTAWFAVLELGVPSALAGLLVGLLTGAAVLAVRRPRS
jgi:hypothetical protein